MNWMTFAPELYYLSMAAVFLVLTTTARPNAQRDYMAALVLSAVGVGVAVAGVRLSGDLFFETVDSIAEDILKIGCLRQYRIFLFH